MFSPLLQEPWWPRQWPATIVMAQMRDRAGDNYGSRYNMSWAFSMFFFFFFFFFKFLLLFSLLNVYLSRDQWMATTITIKKMNVVLRCRCISSSRMLLFFVFFFVLNIYLQWDYMYRMVTRTMHGGLEVGITMNGGRRAWDALWSISSLKYVFSFLSLFIYYINDYLKAAKPMDGNNMGSRGGKWEKGSLRCVAMHFKPQVCYIYIY